MPKVYNRHHKNAPSDAVYIGRGSPYGNPFAIGEHGNRAQVIAKYREYLQANPELLAKVKTELPGKDLVCYCSPSPCHGDILLFEANPELANPKGSLFDIL